MGETTYLASSPLLSLRKGGGVMLLHNAVVVPGRGDKAHDVSMKEEQ